MNLERLKPHFLQHVLIPEWDPGLTNNGTKYAQRVTRLKPSKPSEYTKMQFRDDPFADVPPIRFKDANAFTKIAIQFCEGTIFCKKSILV